MSKLSNPGLILKRAPMEEDNTEFIKTEASLQREKSWLGK